MRMIKLSLFVLVVFGLGIVLAGCSKPPEAEKEAAKKAIDAAISVGADQYASADLEAAKKIWDTAESQMKEKKYKEAKQSYIDAKAAFEKASGAVEAGKKAASEQASGVLASIEKGWKKIEAMGQTMGKQMKDKKEAWVADSKAFSDGL